MGIMWESMQLWKDGRLSPDKVKCVAPEIGPQFGEMEWMAGCDQKVKKPGATESHKYEQLKHC